MFVDYNQNARDRTMASAYSLRRTPRATVSTPLTWDELGSDVDPDDFTLTTFPARFAAVGDLWARARRDGRTPWTRCWRWPTATRGTASATCPTRRATRRCAGEPKRVQPSRARHD